MLCYACGLALVWLLRLLREDTFGAIETCLRHVKARIWYGLLLTVVVLISMHLMDCDLNGTAAGCATRHCLVSSSVQLAFVCYGVS